MKIYFVRHGQTEAAVLKNHQTINEPLTGIGKQQAEILAKRFRSIETEAIYTSPLTRALETAEIISKFNPKPLIQSELLKERVWPSEIRGININDPLYKIVRQKFLEHGDDPSWHYSDEESYSETLNRAKKALTFLENSGHSSIIAVSHSHFLKQILAVITHITDLNNTQFEHFYRSISMQYTSITAVEKADGLWRIITLNDKIHFGEYSSDSEWPH